MKKLFIKIVDMIFLQAEVKAANLVRSQGSFLYIFFSYFDVFIFKYYVVALVHENVFPPVPATNYVIKFSDVKVRMT